MDAANLFKRYFLLRPRIRPDEARGVYTRRANFFILSR